MNNTHNTLYNCAREYTAHGLSVLPITHEKRPVTSLLPLNEQGRRSWKCFQSDIADAATLATWFNNGTPVPKIAIVAGRVSGGLEMIDVDMKADSDGRIWDDFRAMVETLAPELLKRLVIETSVSGGYHVVYRCHETPIPGNHVLAKSVSGECLIETRGEGGYFVCAPSEGYALIQNDFTSIPTISAVEREILLSAARALHRHTEQGKRFHAQMEREASAGKDAAKNYDISPFDDFNARGDVLSLLRKHGWTEVFSNAEAKYLRRPGKSHGVSASFGYVRNANNVPYLYVFSTSTEFEAERIYFPYAVYAVLEHNGDFKRAAYALLAEGYGSKRNQWRTEFSDTLRAAFPSEQQQTGAVQNTETTQHTPQQKDAVAPENTNSLMQEFVWKCLREKQKGDAELFALLARDRFLYDASARVWYEFKEHWREDRTQQIICALPEMLAEEYGVVLGRLERKLSDLSIEAERETRSDVVKHIHKTIEAQKKEIAWVRQRIENLYMLPWVRRVLEFASARLGIYGDEWDADPMLLGVANGVVDLRTGELRPARPTDYIRKVSPTTWEGLETRCPRFQQFILEIFQRYKPDDPNPPQDLVRETVEIADYVHRLLGYSLIGEQREHVYPILWGAEGRNGKDTLLETLSHVLGNNIASSVSKDVVIQSRSLSKGQAAPELYDLWGKRLVWVSETNESDKLNAAQLKLLSGGGAISCRPLYGNQVAFQQTHLLMLTTNHKPLAPSDDQALWERIALIEFRNRFIDEPDPNKPNERKADKNLKEALKKEAAGILAWLVRGCLAWQQKGLIKPDAVKLATSAYRAELDGIDEFLEEQIDTSVSENYTAKCSRVYELYKAFCEENDLRRPVSSKKLTSMLQRRGLQRKRMGDGWYWVGMQVKISGNEF